MHKVRRKEQKPSSGTGFLHWMVNNYWVYGLYVEKKTFLIYYKLNLRKGLYRISKWKRLLFFGWTWRSETGDCFVWTLCQRKYTYPRGLFNKLYFIIAKSFLKKYFQILHALGLFHEHQRPDRDGNINVDMVKAKKYGFFNDVRKACFLKFKITHQSFWKSESKYLRKL